METSLALSPCADRLGEERYTPQKQGPCRAQHAVPHGSASRRREAGSTVRARPRSEAGRCCTYARLGHAQLPAPTGTLRTYRMGSQLGRVSGDSDRLSTDSLRPSAEVVGSWFVGRTPWISSRRAWTTTRSTRSRRRRCPASLVKAIEAPADELAVGEHGVLSLCLGGAARGDGLGVGEPSGQHLVLVRSSVAFAV